MTDDKAAHHAEMAARLERTRQAESARATELLKAFVADATAAGISPEPLTARTDSGRARVRTDIVGWYLKRDRSVAVDAAARFYVLRTPDSLRARWRGAVIEPSDPPIELGRGARDGESMPLADAIANRLAAGNDF